MNRFSEDIIFCIFDDMNWRERIEQDKEVLVGKPTIKGTRVSIEHIVNLLAQGWSEQQILENYPRLQKDDLQAVFAFIKECMQDGLLFHESLEQG
ncbi:MAG: DUF433 domain-containing protein [Bacteroidales bacterium]|nr:DUF433 domain-containing protein [Bacteroidales bacterium]